MNPLFERMIALTGPVIILKGVSILEDTLKSILLPNAQTWTRGPFCVDATTWNVWSILWKGKAEAIYEGFCRTACIKWSLTQMETVGCFNCTLTTRWIVVLFKHKWVGERFVKAYKIFPNWKNNIESPPEKYLSRSGKESNKHKPWGSGKKR